jgi:hypothetical protein
LFGEGPQPLFGLKFKDRVGMFLKSVFAMQTLNEVPALPSPSASCFVVVEGFQLDFVHPLFHVHRSISLLRLNGLSHQCAGSQPTQTAKGGFD